MARFSIQNITQVEENRDTYATEPVTVDEVKEYLQLEGTAYDNVMEIFITASRQMIENYANVSLVAKEIRAQIRNPNYNAFPLPYPPIESVEQLIFKRCASASVDQTYNTDWFFNDADAKAKEIIVPSQACGPNQFFIVHYFTEADERAVFKQAIKAQCGYMFNNRDSDKVNKMAPETEALIRAFKRNYF